MDEAYIVYVRTDGGFVVAVNSSAFLRNTDGWTEIDRGFEEKHHHAQGNYFPQTIQTDGGAWRYKLADGVITECSAEEIAAQESAMPSPAMSDKERIEELEAALELLLSGVTE